MVFSTRCPNSGITQLKDIKVFYYGSSSNYSWMQINPRPCLSIFALGNINRENLIDCERMHFNSSFYKKMFLIWLSIQTTKIKAKKCAKLLQKLWSNEKIFVNDDKTFVFATIKNRISSTMIFLIAKCSLFLPIL